MNELGTNDDLGTLAGLQRMAQEEALAKVNDKRMLRQAAHLLDDALAVLKDRWRTSHLPDCPRRRDDYDCTCGLSDLCGRIEDWCKEVRFETNTGADCGGTGNEQRACPTCHGLRKVPFYTYSIQFDNGVTPAQKVMRACPTCM